jgi:MFS family permease
MARKGEPKAKKEKGRKAKEMPELEAAFVPGTAQQPAELPDTKREAAQQEREAKRKLKQAEADLDRARKREARVERAIDRREMAGDRKLASIERSRTRRTSPLVLALTIPHGIAAAMAIIHLLEFELSLYEPLLYKPSAHWEVVAFCYLGSVIASMALVATSPSSEYQTRARRALQVYFSLGLLMTMIGLLVAGILWPMEGMELDWWPLIWTSLIIVTAAGILVPVAYHFAHYKDSRWHLTSSYHWTMGSLAAVLVVTLFLLPMFFLAQQEWMVEVGLAVLMTGSLGMLFTLPALVGTFVVDLEPGAWGRFSRTVASYFRSSSGRQ